MDRTERSGAVGDGGFDRAGEAGEGTEGVVDRAGLVPTVDHAVAALLVAALLAVLFPHGVGHEFFKGGDVTVLEEVAGFLPTEDVVGGVTPRSAVVIDVALEEFEEVRREIEFPGFFALVKDFLEKFFGAFPAKEMFLIGRFLVAVTRGEHHALNLELHHLIKKFANAGGIGAFKEGGVGGDAEAAGDGLLNAFEGGFVGAIAADGGVVFGFEPVHVHAEGEIFSWLKEIDLTFEEEGVGAEVNVFLAGDEAFDNFIDLGMDEGFAAGNGDHGGPALVRRGPALFGGKAFVEDVVGVLDLAATRAGEVTTEEGFEHEDEGVASVASELLTENIGGNRPSLANRNWHKRSSEATNTIAYVNGTRGA